MAAAAANGMTRITLSFLLSLLSDNNIGPEAPVNSKHHWSYKGPEGPQSWPLHYKFCAGSSQSPVDIETGRAVFDEGLGLFHLDNFNTYSQTNGPTTLNITNNGHAASVRVTSNMRVSGGGLSGTYKTAEFHFHWGSMDDVGSEHALNGRKFPVEMHVVNFAEKYGTIQEAMTQPDGLAVLGVFFELSDTDNPEFAALSDALRYVHKAGEHNLVDRLRLRALLPDDISRYWRYSGSLTTPFCFESVTWTVFATPQKISRSQLATLRSLLHEEGHDKGDKSRSGNPTPSRLVDNWRPLQPLNGRRVYRSFDDEIRLSPTLSTSPEIEVASAAKQHMAKAFDNSIPTTNAALPTMVTSHMVTEGDGRKEIRQENPVKTNPGPTPTEASVLPSFPSRVKLKISPTSHSGSNSVGYEAHVTDPGAELPKSEQNLNRGFIESKSDITSSRLHSKNDVNNTMNTAQAFAVPALNSNTLNNRQQLQTQKKLIELQNQQYEQNLQKLQRQQQQQQLMQLQRQQHQSAEPVVPPNLPSKQDPLPSIPTIQNVQPIRSRLESSAPPRGGTIQNQVGGRNSARSLGNRVMITNDGTLSRDRIDGAKQNSQTSWGRQTNQPNAMFLSQTSLQREPQQQQNQQQQQPRPLRLTPTSASSPQELRRYIKPLDPNTKFTFLRDGYHQRGPQTFLQPRFQDQKRLQENPTPMTYNYNSQYPYQRQQAETKSSLFSHLSNQATPQRSSAGFQQPTYRAYTVQSTRPQPSVIPRQQQQMKQTQQRQLMSRQQTQQIPVGTKLTADQLRILLQKLASTNRGQTGSQTIMSPASRMLPSVSEVNAVSSLGVSGGRDVMTSRNTLRDIGARPAKHVNRRPPILTSGRNPVLPFSTNQRVQRISGQISPQPYSTSSQQSAASSLSPPPTSSSSSSSSSSMLYSNQPTYQSRNRIPSSYSRTGNNNWFFTGARANDGGPKPTEELPYVFLHRIQKPVRIRRPFYERLYNV